jgi:alpha-beta hydrolase superfamily lysophospholipase
LLVFSSPSCVDFLDRSPGHQAMSSSGTTTMEEVSGRGPPQHHFVLVHGVSHSTWCWYRVATLLTSAGHRVTALDMAGCGASPARGEDVASFEDYSWPRCRPESKRSSSDTASAG